MKFKLRVKDAHITFEARWDWRIWSFGVFLHFWSWSNAYPWFQGGVAFGPLLLQGDIAVPPNGEYVGVETLLTGR